MCRGDGQKKTDETNAALDPNWRQPTKTKCICANGARGLDEERRGGGGKRNGKYIDGPLVSGCHSTSINYKTTQLGRRLASL